MTIDKYNYQKYSEYSYTASARRGFDITPSSNDLAIPTRAITLSDDSTVTGILVGQDESHTTHTLIAGVMHAFAFSRITALGTGGATVKGYA